MKFSPYLPIKPFILTQGWATYNPAVYSQFGYSNHNGIDAKIVPGALINAPYDGTIIRTGNQPTGGGLFCGLLSSAPFDFPAFSCATPDGKIVSFPAATCYVLMDFLHQDRLVVGEGQQVKAGDVIGIQDNTGFSTGPHTHVQPRREYLKAIVNNKPDVQPSYRILGNNYLVDVDTNAANNSFDPTQFWNGMYAADISSLDAVLNKTETVVQAITQAPVSMKDKIQLLDYLKKVVQGLLNLFKK